KAAVSARPSTHWRVPRFFPCCRIQCAYELPPRRWLPYPLLKVVQASASKTQSNYSPAEQRHRSSSLAHFGYLRVVCGDNKKRFTTNTQRNTKDASNRVMMRTPVCEVE